MCLLHSASYCLFLLLNYAGEMEFNIPIFSNLEFLGLAFQGREFVKVGGSNTVENSRRESKSIPSKHILAVQAAQCQLSEAFYSKYIGTL